MVILPFVSQFVYKCIAFCRFSQEMSQDAEVKMTDDKCCILHNFAHVVSHILFMHTFLNNAEYTISGLC